MIPPDDSPSPAPARDCGGCALRTSRRDFVGGLATTLAALAIDGLLPGGAAALPATLVRGDAIEGQQVRYPIPASDGVSIDRKQGVIIARHAGMLYAFALTCPHQNTALRWNEGSRNFFCTRHKSKYRPDGLFISGRATRAMDRFAVRKEGDALVVDLDTLFEQDVDLAGWSGAHVAA
jgi:nitrite reductase/ring-hydroxylating ferredoxin subunit